MPVGQQPDGGRILAPVGSDQRACPARPVATHQSVIAQLRVHALRDQQLDEMLLQRRTCAGTTEGTPAHASPP